MLGPIHFELYEMHQERHHFHPNMNKFAKQKNDTIGNHLLNLSLSMN